MRNRKRERLRQTRRRKWEKREQQRKKRVREKTDQDAAFQDTQKEGEWLLVVWLHVVGKEDKDKSRLRKRKRKRGAYQERPKRLRLSGQCCGLAFSSCRFASFFPLLNYAGEYREKPKSSRKERNRPLYVYLRVLRERGRKTEPPEQEEQVVKSEKERRGLFLSFLDSPPCRPPPSSFSSKRIFASLALNPALSHASFVPLCVSLALPVLSLLFRRERSGRIQASQPP